MKQEIRLLRPEQWVKNLFVFAPMFFGGRLLDSELWVDEMLAFITLCVAASAVYCFNDAQDATSDRLHPEKRNRPVAAGYVGERRARAIAAMLGGISIVLGYALGGIAGFGIIAAYLSINAGYSMGLKRVRWVDVALLAFGFELRMAFGAEVGGIWLSGWIMVMVFLLTAMLVLGKRRHDAIATTGGGVYGRRMSSVGLSVAGCAVIAGYTMFSFSPVVEARFGTTQLYMTIPFVVAGVARFIWLAFRKNRTGNPTKLFLCDRFIGVSVALWLAAFALIIYL